MDTVQKILPAAGIFRQVQTADFAGDRLLLPRYLAAQAVSQLFWRTLPAHHPAIVRRRRRHKFR
ncbi:hypothetical protein BKC11_01395 [Salmonella enterica subsp. enterica serovar Typhimurium]|nr:hypothetical protein BKC11_01395 [Salmonella enterica subsp. enterica serovar Typhimurium]